MISRPIELTEYYKWYVGFYPRPMPFIAFDPDHVEATAGVALVNFSVSASVLWSGSNRGVIENGTWGWELVDVGTTGDGNVTFSIVDDFGNIKVSVLAKATAGTAVIRAVTSVSGLVYTGYLDVIVQ